jgi:hypothetical protein
LPATTSTWAQGPPRPDRVPVLPESTTQPAALQNNEVDLIYANVGDDATRVGPFWNSGLWPQKAA